MGCYKKEVMRANLCHLYFSGCEGDECSRSQTSSSSSSVLSTSVSFSASSFLVEKSPQPSQDILGQFSQVSSSNSGDRKHRDASAVLPFIGLTGSKFKHKYCVYIRRNWALKTSEEKNLSLCPKQEETNLMLIFPSQTEPWNTDQSVKNVSKIYQVVHLSFWPRKCKVNQIYKSVNAIVKKNIHLVEFLNKWGTLKTNI